MYKKRFAKWGFQKNSRHTVAENHGRKVTSKRCHPPREQASIPTCPRLGHQDGLMLMLLTSVRICSVAFFESVRPRDDFLASHQQWPEQIDESSFTFKLVMDLLDRGYGKLAGRLARKAFLLAEDMLTLKGPVLVWNLLEMMHYMVTLRHAQLFHMLLAHVSALTDGRMPKSHPISAMLRGLRGLVASLAGVPSTPGSSTPPSLPSPSAGGDPTATPARPWLPSPSLSSLIEQAWTLNAEILFDHFDPRLLLLYCEIHWHSCSIAPPAAMISTANQWLSHIAAQQVSHTGAEARRAHDLCIGTLVDEDGVHQHPFTLETDSSLPHDYETLYASSVAALWEHGSPILSGKSGFTGDATIQLRILASLVMAQTLEEWSTVGTPPGTARGMATRMSRNDASIIACAIRALIDVETGHGGDGLRGPLDVVQRIRSIVALREYARTETDPQVVQEMWLLEDALVAAGNFEEAHKVGQTAFRRLERYVQDIPIDSV